MDNATLESRLGAVERLTALFRVERLAYLFITSVSLLMLLGCAGFLIFQSRADMAVLGGLFGSSGLITYSLGRLLRMWDQALQVLVGSEVKGNIGSEEKGN